MSEFEERIIRAGKETTWGTYSSGLSPIYYAIAFDATTTETLIEEELITVSRQAKSRAYGRREIAGSVEFKLLTPKILYFALGSVTEDASAPYTVTISGSAELPSFSIERVLKSAETGGPTIAAGYMGAKIDRLELRIDPDTDIVCAVDFVPKDNTFPAYLFSSVSPTSDQFSHSPFAYFEAEFKWGSEVHTIRSMRIEVANNLEARTGLNSTVPIAIRGGDQEFTGEFTLDEGTVNLFAQNFARGRVEGTIEVNIGDERGTMKIQLFRVSLLEFRDELRGRDYYEPTFPFKARASGPAAYDACSITWTSPTWGSIDAMIW